MERCGGSFWSGQQFGAVWVMADDGPISHLIFRNLEVRDTTYSGIMLKSETCKSVVHRMEVTFENVQVVKTGTHGILLQDALGTTTFRNTGLREVSGKPVLRIKDTNGQRGPGTITLTTGPTSVGIVE